MEVLIIIVVHLARAEKKIEITPGYNPFFGLSQ